MSWLIRGTAVGRKVCLVQSRTSCLWLSYQEQGAEKDNRFVTICYTIDNVRKIRIVPGRWGLTDFRDFLENRAYVHLLDSAQGFWPALAVMTNAKPSHFRVWLSQLEVLVEQANGLFVCRFCLFSILYSIPSWCSQIAANVNSARCFRRIETWCSYWDWFITILSELCLAWLLFLLCTGEPVITFTT